MCAASGSQRGEANANRMLLENTNRREYLGDLNAGERTVL